MLRNYYNRKSPAAFDRLRANAAGLPGMGDNDGLTCWFPENRDKRLDIRDKRIEGKEETQLSAPILYGEYKNIRLTDEEYQKLKNKLQNHTDTMIEKLSRYLKSKGTDCKDHYVTILNWYEQDKEKLTQKNIQNGSSKTYSTNYEDSDSL